MRLRRPRSVLANVNEADSLRLTTVVGDIAEQARLLRAGDDNVTAGVIGKRSKLLLAKLGANRQRTSQLERASERRRVERHGAVAIAEVKSLVANAHGFAEGGSRLAAPLVSGLSLIRIAFTTGCPKPLRGTKRRLS